MALCHDERDFAMGFSRHDPSIRRGPSDAELRRRDERKRYLKSLTPARKKARDRVAFCLAAVGQYFVACGRMVPIGHKDLHDHFPAFAKRMGWGGLFYRKKDGKCPAVNIAYPENPESVWILTPYFDYDRMDEDERRHVHTKKARQAALDFCKAWLPDWRWDEVALLNTA